MITQEERVKIFALYWGQKIDTSLNGTPISARWMEKLEDGKLDASILVKPLSQISDEDAIEVAKMWGDDGSSSIANKCIVSRILDEKYRAYKPIPKILEITDFLRSKGYALPYLNYSVVELVAEGVFKFI